MDQLDAERTCYRRIQFEPWHIRTLDIQPDQESELHHINELTDDQWAAIGQSSASQSGTMGSQLLCCYGVIACWPGRARAWCMVDKGVGARGLLCMTRDITDFLDVLQGSPCGSCRRIETTVRAQFVNGHAWIRRLGFRPEGYMKRYDPDGLDHVLYSRIRE